MAGETKTTRDHEEIRRWAEDRGGRPARLHHAFGAKPESCHLQIDFLQEKYNDDVEPIAWEAFFELFDREQMVLVYQTETEGGKKSCFARIVKQEGVAQALIE